MQQHMHSDKNYCTAPGTGRSIACDTYGPNRGGTRQNAAGYCGAPSSGPLQSAGRGSERGGASWGPSGGQCRLCYRPGAPTNSRCSGTGGNTRTGSPGPSAALRPTKASREPICAEPGAEPRRAEPRDAGEPVIPYSSRVSINRSKTNQYEIAAH